MNIFSWLKLRRKQKQAENELVDWIIKSMQIEPQKWEIDSYSADYGKLSIWISNSPYADMTINSRRLPRRGELRKALAICAATQLIQTEADVKRLMKKGNYNKYEIQAVPIEIHLTCPVRKTK